MKHCYDDSRGSGTCGGQGDRGDLPAIPRSTFGCVWIGGARVYARGDVDLFVEFEAGYHPGLQWVDLEEDLEKVLVRRVDLSRKALLKARLRGEAERDAVGAIYGVSGIRWRAT